MLHTRIALCCDSNVHTSLTRRVMQFVRYNMFVAEVVVISVYLQHYLPFVYSLLAQSDCLHITTTHRHITRLYMYSVCT